MGTPSIIHGLPMSMDITIFASLANCSSVKQLDVPASKTRVGGLLWHQFPSALAASASCGTSFGLLWQPQNGG